MKSPLRYGVMGLMASAMMFAAGEARGQEAEGQPAAKSPVEAARLHRAQQEAAAQASYGPIVSVDFGGGTIEEYVTALQRSSREKPLNVIVPMEARRVILPAITLRDVSSFTALSAIESAFERNSEHQFSVTRVTGSSSESAAYAVGYQRANQRTQYPGSQGVQDPRTIEVYSIRDLIEPPVGVENSPESRVAYESILSAIEAAIAMLEGEEGIKLMYHKETGLMLVGGSRQQTQMVSSVIGRLREDLQKRWAQQAASKAENVEQTQRLSGLRLELDIAEREFQMAMRQVEYLSKRVEGGFAARDELNAAEANAAKAKMVLDRRQMELDSVQKTIGSPREYVLYDIQDLLIGDEQIGEKLIKITEAMDATSKEVNKSLMVHAEPKTHAALLKLLEIVRKKGGEKAK